MMAPLGSVSICRVYPSKTPLYCFSAILISRTALSQVRFRIEKEGYVFIDGVRMGLSGSPINLSPGRHALRLVKPGYRDLETTIEVGTASPVPLIKMTQKSPAVKKQDH